MGIIKAIIITVQIIELRKFNVLCVTKPKFARCYHICIKESLYGIGTPGCMKVVGNQDTSLVV